MFFRQSKISFCYSERPRCLTGRAYAAATRAGAFTRWLGRLGGTIEKIYDTSPQTVLSSDDQQPVVFN